MKDEEWQRRMKTREDFRMSPAEAHADRKMVEFLTGRILSIKAAIDNEAPDLAIKDLMSLADFLQRMEDWKNTP